MLFYFRENLLFLLFIAAKLKEDYSVSGMGSMTQSVLHFPSGCNKMTFIAHLRLCPFRIMGHSLVSGNKLHYIPLHTDFFFLHNARELKKKKERIKVSEFQNVLY